MLKKYRIKYWLCSFITEAFICALNAADAEQKFRDVKGNNKIIDISEIN